METLAIDDVPHSPHPRGVTTVRRLLGDELGDDEIDVTYYEIDSDDQFAGAYHRHLEREEVFIVLCGTAGFRTEDGTRTVTENEAIHFAPGDWQLGYNDGETQVTALLIGAPKELAPVEAYLDCSACAEQTRFVVNPESQASGEEMREKRVCTECETAFDLDS